MRLADFGWVGVDLFFVLSGFLITRNLLNSAGKERYYTSFFLARATRILPLYLFILVLVIALLPALGYDLSNSTSVDQWWFWSYLGNFWLIGHHGKALPPFTILWSLAIEEQFYLVWPLAISVLFRRKALRWLAVLPILPLAIRTVWVLLTASPIAIYYSTFSRLDGLLVGALIAYYLPMLTTWVRSQPVKTVTMGSTVIGSTAVATFASASIGFAGIAPIWQTWPPDLAIFGYSAISILAGLCLLLAVRGRGFYIKILESSFLRFFGKISYGLYMWHMIVYVAMWKTGILPDPRSIHFLHPIFATVVAALLPAVISILVSLISYRWLETPFMTLRKRLESPTFEVAAAN